MWDVCWCPLLTAKRISQIGYPSIPPGFVSWPSSYSQSLFPSLRVSIQDFPAFCPAQRMKPGIRPQGSFSLNGQDWRRTRCCKPYFSGVATVFLSCSKSHFSRSTSVFLHIHQAPATRLTSSAGDTIHDISKFLLTVTYGSPRKNWFFWN